MAQPTRFTPPYDFSAAGVPQGNKFDVTFQAIKQTLDQIISRLALIQRDDGSLANGAVHADALSRAVIGLLAIGEGSPRGDWMAGEFYRQKDVVAYLGQTFICAAPHYATSEFSNDVANWMILQSTGVLVEAASTTLKPVGDVGSTNVQNAISELDAEKAAISGDTGRAFNVGAPTSAAHSAQLKQLQDNSARFMIGVGTGNAIVATLAPAAFTSLPDGVELFVRAPGANTVVAPTLNLTLGTVATGPVSICRDTDGSALLPGSIAGASHVLHLIYSLPLLKWQLLNPAA